jgi:hypothetical protein
MVERGKDCNFILQVARMFLDMTSLNDLIPMKNRLKWYRKCAVSYCLNSLSEHTSWR